MNVRVIFTDGSETEVALVKEVRIAEHSELRLTHSMYSLSFQDMGLFNTTEEKQ
jgi:hypothetical protein